MVKVVTYTREAVVALRRHRADAARIMAKVDRYAETGAGDVKPLVGTTARRLRIGDYRVIFDETATTITVTKIAPRGSVYE